MGQSVYFGAIGAGVIILFSSFSGYAQVVVPFKKTELAIKSEQNPFDNVQDIVDNNRSHKKRAGLENAPKNGTKSKISKSLKYQKKYTGSPQQAQAVYKSLVGQYGQPKSVRGKSYVWDIKNPSKNSVQADIVTVILKMDTSGTYELVMDRDRGENGRATWDATRVKKANTKEKVKAKLGKQKKTNSRLILQEDND